MGIQNEPKGLIVPSLFALSAALSTATTTDSLTRTSQIVEYETSIQKALAWLITQRESDWGWRNDTPKVLVALQLAKIDDFNNGIIPSQLELQLSSKQMEVEIVTLLWR